MSIGTHLAAILLALLSDWLRKHPDVWVGTFQEVLDYVSARTR